MKILFVCEYNACRSQMGEGIARALGHDVSVDSAGIHPGILNPVTVEVMQEIGIDISTQQTKRLPAVAGTVFDHTIVLAEPAFEETRRVIRTAECLLWPYPDPLRTEGSEEAVRQAVREVRDSLRGRISDFMRDKMNGRPRI